MAYCRKCPLRCTSRRLLHASVMNAHLDQVTKWFKHIMIRDGEFYELLAEIDQLWPEPNPYINHGFSHHDGMRGAVS